MFPEFVVPQTISELEGDATSANGIFRVTNSPKLDRMDADSMQRQLEGVGSTLLRRGGIEQLSENDNFGVLLSFVRCALRPFHPLFLILLLPVFGGSISPHTPPLPSMYCALADHKSCYAPPPSYNECRTFPTLQAQTQSRLLDVLGRAVRAAIVPFRKGRKEAEEAGADGPTRAQCNALKMATYLLFSTISSAESAHVAGEAAEGYRKRRLNKTDHDVDGSFDWAAHREAAVFALAEVLEADTPKLWTMGVPDENFITLFCRVSYQLLEQPVAGRSGAFKTTLLHLIARPMHLVHSIETQVVATVMHLLNSYEHTITAVAELCRIMACDMNDVRLATSVLREAVRIDLTSATVRNGTGLKHIASFITELSVVLPSVVMQNMGVLLPLLDAEPYALRSAIVAVVGNAVAGSTPADVAGDQGIGVATGESCQMHSERVFTRTRDSLLDVLTERAHDVNSFTRAAVIKAWSALCEKQVLPLVRVHSVVMVATDRVQDKSVVVRRASIQVSVSLPLRIAPPPLRSQGLVLI